MRRRPPRSTRTDTLFPYTTLFRSRQLAGGLIYELHIGTFTPEGTLDAAIGRLGHLVDLGVTHVEVLPVNGFNGVWNWGYRSEEHTSELQSLMRISYAVFCLKKKKSKQMTTVKAQPIESQLSQ